MRQSNKSGSVRNDETFNLHLRSTTGPESASPASCKTPATFIDSICQNDKLEKGKEPRNENQLPTNCIILPRPT